MPAHLRVTYAVVDDRGRTVGAGKDLDALQHRLRDATRDSVARVTQGGGSDDRGRGRGRGRGGAVPPGEHGAPGWRTPSSARG
nr:hypothetical protein GCM10025699_61870 [Microbacterium flavescens]